MLWGAAKMLEGGRVRKSENVKKRTGQQRWFWLGVHDCSWTVSHLHVSEGWFAPFFIHLYWQHYKRLKMAGVYKNALKNVMCFKLKVGYLINSILIWFFLGCHKALHEIGLFCKCTCFYSITSNLLFWNHWVSPVLRASQLCSSERRMAA